MWPGFGKREWERAAGGQESWPWGTREELTLFSLKAEIEMSIHWPGFTSEEWLAYRVSFVEWEEPRV